MDIYKHTVVFYTHGEVDLDYLVTEMINCCQDEEGCDTPAWLTESGSEEVRGEEAIEIATEADWLYTPEETARDYADYLYCKAKDK